MRAAVSEWEVPVQEPGAVLPLGWQAEVRRTHDDGSVLLLQAQVHNVMYYRPEIVDYSAFLVRPGLPRDTRLMTVMFLFLLQSGQLSWVSFT